jgi:hypothetical protein
MASAFYVDESRIESIAAGASSELAHGPRPIRRSARAGRANSAWIMIMRDANERGSIDNVEGDQEKAIDSASHDGGSLSVGGQQRDFGAPPKAT